MRQTASLPALSASNRLLYAWEIEDTKGKTYVHDEQGLVDRYEEYLESILDSTEEFHEIEDIMSRHATLQATNTDLMEQQQRVSDLAEQSRCTLGTFALDQTSQRASSALSHVKSFHNARDNWGR